MITWIAVLAMQFTALSARSAGTVLEGHWQSCLVDGEYQERVFDHPSKPAFEFHLGPGEEFALFRGVRDTHREHSSPDNLLGPSYRAGDLQTWRGKRNWTVPSLGLWVSVVQAGGSRDECESWWVKVTRHGSER